MAGWRFIIGLRQLLSREVGSLITYSELQRALFKDSFRVSNMYFTI